MPTITTVCRCCGRPLVFAEGMELVTCVACGTLNERPKAKGPALGLLQRATEQRLRCDFINAENSYQHVLLDHPDEHEALWGLVLCRYGVEYVEDPHTRRRLPVVHGVRRKPMQLDSDFRQACELAPAAVRSQYEAEAEYIDNAMVKIRDLAETCPPFDVFICHKTTRPGSKEYTEDYTRAFKLYHLLDKQGYRAFFAPMEMEGVAAGSDYEAGIYHALCTARVMLVVCSREDYLTSPWVRSEWQRFCELMDEDGSRNLLPLLYGEMPSARLPLDFRVRKLQAIAMGEMGSAEKMLAAVQKFAGEGEPAEPPYISEADFETHISVGECRILGYHGSAEIVRIPPEIHGAEVVAIGEHAFEDCAQIREIVLPEGIRWIGSFAFATCGQLEVLTLPESVQEIGDYAMAECTSLREIRVAPGNDVFHVQDQMLMHRDGTLVQYPAGLPEERCTVPEKVRRIGVNAFAASRLKRVTLPFGVTELADCAFAHCNDLTEIHIPASVETIGEAAFAYCSSLSAVTLPEGVRGLGEAAFTFCPALERVELPRSLTDLGKNAFAASPVTLMVQVGSEAHRYAQAYDIPFTMPGAAKAPVTERLICAPESHFRTKMQYGECWISRYEGSGGVVVVPPEIAGKPVTHIDENAFKECAGVTEVILPDSIRWIGNYAFSDCPALEKIHLPEALEEIGEYLFADCASLRELTIPKSVITIHGSAFMGCTGLTGIALSPENPHFTLKRNVLMSSFGSLTRFFPDSTQPHYAVPEGVLIIGDYAFDSCSHLQNVTLPEGLRSIGVCAFADCTGLTAVTLPDTVIELGYGAFINCTDLMYVKMPGELLSIGESVFHNCPRLAELTIPRKVEEIESLAFDGCPDLVLQVYEGTFGHTFAQREEIAHVVIDEAESPSAAEAAPTPPAPAAAEKLHFDPVPDSAFETSRVESGCMITKYTGNAEHLRIPEMLNGERVTKLNSFLFQHDHMLCTVHLPEHLREIGVWTFDDCLRLSAITVEASNPNYISMDGVLYTRDGTLVQMPQGHPARNFTVPEGVTHIGFRAFEKCRSLESVTLPESLEHISFNAFSHCTSLRRIVIPQKVKTIDTYAFSDCTTLTSVKLHEGLTTLASHAFDGCTNLQILNLPKSLKKIGNSVFHGCDKLPQEIRKRSWDSPLAGVAKWFRT